MTAAFFSPRLESIQFGYQLSMRPIQEACLHALAIAHALDESSLDFIQHLITRPKVDDASIVVGPIQ
jgi:hypothetical protein